MFLGMLIATIKRRQLWSVTPMDPAAWYVLLSKHQTDLAANQAAALANSPPALEIWGAQSKVSATPLSGWSAKYVRRLLM